MGVKQLVNSVVVVTVTALLSKVLGVVREMVLAAFFGASQVMDAFLIALMIPDFLALAFRTCISTAFIPVYNSYLATNQAEKAEALVNTILSIILIVLIIAVVLGFIFAQPIIAFVAPGFSPESQALTVNLTRILLPMLLFSGLVGLMTGMQQAHNIFLYPALIYAIANVAMIIFVAALAAKLGIYAAAMATIAGVVLQLAVQWPGVAKCRHNFKLSADFSLDGVKRMGLLIIPVLIGMTANSACMIVDRILASSLPLGSISALGYAAKINAVFVGLFAVPISTVMYPTLSQFIARGEIESFKNHLNMGIRIIAFIIIPIVLLVIAFRGPIVSALLERGVFDGKAVQTTAFALGFFALGMLGMALLDLLNQAFYAQQNTRIPVMVTIGIVSVNILLNFILIQPLAHGGLALATSISITLGVCTLLLLLRMRLGPLGGRQLLIGLGKISVAASVMVLTGAVFFKGVTAVGIYVRSDWHGLLALLFTVGLSILVYLSVSFLLKCEELMFLLNLLSQRFPRLRHWLKFAAYRAGSGAKSQ